MPDGVLNLSVVDVYGDSVNEPLDIYLDNTTLTDKRVIRGQKPAKTMRIANLNQRPNGRYRIEVDAPSYVAVSQFTELASQPVPLTLTLPVNIKRIVSVVFPPYAAIPGTIQGLIDKALLTLYPKDSNEDCQCTSSEDFPVRKLDHPKGAALNLSSNSAGDHSCHNHFASSLWAIPCHGVRACATNTNTTFWQKTAWPPRTPKA